jgi:hypothetical protein
VNSKPFPISEKILNHFTQISDTEKDFGDAISPQKRDLMFQKWTPTNFNQALREFFR